MFALIAALSQGPLIRQLREIQAAVDAPKETPKAPPPPPPQFVKPKPPVAIIPQFAVQSSTPAPITTVPKQNVAPPAAPIIHAISSEPLRPILSTHTPPPYPPIARRLSEQGTTLMEVTITTQGNVGNCTIARSSSSDRLDQAACDFVKQHWRWTPPTRAGKPVSAKTRVSVTWTLLNSN